MGLFKSVSSDMLNTQLEKIEEAVKTAESATGHFVYNLCHYCPVKAGKSVFEIVET